MHASCGLQPLNLSPCGLAAPNNFYFVSTPISLVMVFLLTHSLPHLLNGRLYCDQWLNMLGLYLWSLIGVGRDEDSEGWI